MKPKSKSAAQIRRDLQAEVTNLRTQAATKRAEADDLDDVAAIKTILAEAKKLEASASEAEDKLRLKLEAEDRRARRDGLLSKAERKARRKDGSLLFDPTSEEMRELYAERLHISDVITHGAKAIRDDGGPNGALGKLINEVVEGLQHAGLAPLTPEQLKAVIAAARWASMERLHGIALGYTRDAAWILHLHATATGQPLDVTGLPVRQPLPDRTKWQSTMFESDYADSLGKLGLAPAVSSSEEEEPEDENNADGEEAA